MKLTIKLIYLILLVAAFAVYIGCKNRHKPEENEIVKNPEEIDDQIPDNLKSVLQYSNDNNGKIEDSSRLSLYGIVSAFYDNNGYHNQWSRKGKWLPIADSMIGFIEHARYCGLYPNDYHSERIASLRKIFLEDSLAKKDVVFWTKADLLLTDAFMKTIKDLKEGRLLPDSISIINNKKFVDSFFVKSLQKAVNANSIAPLFAGVEPLNMAYQSLKHAMKNFVDSMDTARYTYIVYPLKDSLHLIENIQKRLTESNIAKRNIAMPDSATLDNEIRKFQQEHGLKPDGKISAKLVRKLNNTDGDKFKRIAITLDRYKRMPALPVRYIWVNLPGYYLKLFDHDSVALESKVIVGKPDTRTPILNSAISDMVIYPQWTIPESIIKKDILPALKKDPGYLDRKGFSLLDAKGESVNPYIVDWQKYTKGIPWKVRQGSGDDNALGIFKFNFSNPYNVYLHDTNQRYLFKNSSRALSHGCVRVQNWQGLAYYIARNDSMNISAGQKLLYNEDSIKTWVANKSRKQIILKNKFPLYIKYFTCEAKDGKLIFYDDIYNEDRIYAEKYFANK
ncbi:MAG: L,D-transpeptidase family protein [Bacteroidota bacterium]|nr:L,D-transpeptidase family protein [Bacteroidota bacterium]